jgi:hypothetical protein
MQLGVRGWKTLDVDSKAGAAKLKRYGTLAYAPTSCPEASGSARRAASRLMGVSLYCLFKKDDKYGSCGTSFYSGRYGYG